MSNIELPAEMAERCTTAPPPASLAGKLRWLGDLDHEAGCANTGPWWTSAYLGAIIALAANYLLGVAGIGFALSVVLGISAAGIYLVTAFYLSPTRYHGFCEICGLCSAQEGIPAARHRDDANQALRAAGWTISPRGHRAHCQDHAAVPFVYTHTGRLTGL